MNDQIPDLKIERIKDETGEGLILLEQDSGGNREAVVIHPIHLRYMAEKFGLVPSGDAEAQRAITTLQRRLLTINKRAAYLADYLGNQTAHETTDAAYEATYARATADLASEFCMELVGAEIPTASKVAGA